MRGKDIKRYKYQFADLYLINTHNGIEERGVPPVNIKDYPAIKEHLDGYYDRIKKRGDQGITSYNLRSCAYMDDFNKRKIVYSEIVQKPQFYLDKQGEFFIEASGFIMTGADLDYLIDWLNSPTIAWIFKRFYAGGGLGDTGYRYKKDFLINLPIPKLTTPSTFQNYERYIQERIGLTEEEIKFISSFER